MIRIGQIARRRIRHNKSTSILTAVAMILTTCLLMTLGTGALGMVQANQRYLEEAGSNHHAVISQITEEQIGVLAGHMDVDSLYIREFAAVVAKDKINANLIYQETVRPGINTAALTEGRHPQEAFEISGPPSFFERMGAEARVGGTVEIPYRMGGEGEILTGTFAITGLVEQLDLSVLDVSDTRIAYAAFVSKAFAEAVEDGAERNRVVFYRVTGQDTLSGGELEARVYSVAADAGVLEEFVSLNEGYLLWTTGMDTDMLVGVAGIALLIVVFCALILYSIYYVSVITSIQELGKLRALGASKGQLRRLVLTEGLSLAAVSIPIGLVLGYCLAYFGSGYLFGMLNRQAGMAVANMFSLPVVLIVVFVVLGTVVLSLLRPMGIAAKISPMEAIRYQETTTGKQARRKGFATVTPFRLSRANMSRNRRRSLVTVLALGMGCVLFMVVASVLTSMRAEDLAHRALPMGEFKLEYLYALDEKTYVEDNLCNIQMANPLGEETVARILELPGVTGVTRRLELMAQIEHEGYNQEIQWITLTGVTRENFDGPLLDWRRGARDYDEMLGSNGIVFNWDSFYAFYGFTVGEELPLTLYLGEETKEWTASLQGSSNSPLGSNFLVPVELLEELAGERDLTTALYIDVEPEAYDSVKTALQELEDEDIRFRLYSMDEEISIANYSMQFIALIAYAFLLILGVISFMNLINTMVTSIVTRRRELGLLQAVGLSDRQMTAMLGREGLVFTGSALVIALTVGSLLGRVAFQWAKSTGFMDVTFYRFPLVEALVMVTVLLVGQLLITCFLGRFMGKETVIDRLRV